MIRHDDDLGVALAVSRRVAVPRESVFRCRILLLLVVGRNIIKSGGRALRVAFPCELCHS